MHDDEVHAAAGEQLVVVVVQILVMPAVPRKSLVARVREVLVVERRRLVVIARPIRTARRRRGGSCSRWRACHSDDRLLCSTMSPSWVTKTMLRAALLFDDPLRL